MPSSHSAAIGSLDVDRRQRDQQVVTLEEEVEQAHARIQADQAEQPQQGDAGKPEADVAVEQRPGHGGEKHR